jgi:hypothetical protein
MNKKLLESPALFSHLLDIRGIAQSGSAPALGAGCRGFKSLYPDHFRVFIRCLVGTSLLLNLEKLSSGKDKRL